MRPLLIVWDCEVGCGSLKHGLSVATGMTRQTLYTITPVIISKSHRRIEHQLTKMRVRHVWTAGIPGAGVPITCVMTAGIPRVSVPITCAIDGWYPASRCAKHVRH